jgi:hypothetical protein
MIGRADHRGLCDRPTSARENADSFGEKMVWAFVHSLFWNF